MTSKSVPQNERIEILIYAPKEPIRIVWAIPSGQVQTLNLLYPNEMRTFIYQGLILNSERSFESYHIHNKETIIALSPKIANNYNTLQKWIDFSQEGEDFHRKIQSIINPTSLLEVAKINDLHMIKLFQKPKFYQKVSRSFLSEEKSQPFFDSKNEINFEQLSAPSTDALPVFW